jgi:hypothetical protein
LLIASFSLITPLLLLHNNKKQHNDAATAQVTDKMKQYTGNGFDYDDDSYHDVSSYSNDEDGYVTSDYDVSAHNKKPAATNKEDLAVVVNTKVILDDNDDEEEVIDILFKDDDGPEV